MRFWVLAVIPLVLAGLITAEYVREAHRTRDDAVLASLAHDLRFTYHECVPLGWAPVAVSGSYYPGYTASIQNYGLWLDALWRGHVDRRDLKTAQARTVFATLNHLVRAGLLRRKTAPSGFDYFLTTSALPYFNGSSVFLNNRDSLPYLCYSSISPTHVEWVAPDAAAPSRRGVKWYHVKFSWVPSAPPAWAHDPFLRAHSVVLAPITSPTIASIEYVDGDWTLANLYDRGWMLPALSQATAPGRTLR